MLGWEALLAGPELLETEVDHWGSATVEFANVGDGVSSGNGVKETLGSKNTMLVGISIKPRLMTDCLRHPFFQR